MISSNNNRDKESSKKNDDYVDPEFQQYIEAVALAILNDETTIEAEHDMLVQNCSMFNADPEQIENILKELKSAFLDAISSGSPYSRKYVGMLCAQCNASDNFSETVDALIGTTIMDIKQKAESERKYKELKLSIISNSKTGKYGFIDYKGNVVIEPCFVSVGNFHDGLAMAQKEKKWGFINYKGEEVIPFVYDAVGDFHEGMAAVKRSSKWGFVDITGKEVVPRKYISEAHRYTCFNEGLAVIVKNHKCGYVDKMGNEVIPCKYDCAGKFSDGLACVVLPHGPWAIINKEDKVLFELKYDDCGTYVEGYLSVAVDTSSGMRWGFIDKEGKEVVPCIYEMVNDFHEGMAVVVKDGRYGFIDINGREIIPCSYNYVQDFSDGLSFVQDDNYLMGVIDMKGHLVVPCKYSDADRFSEGLAAVRFNDNWGYIDKGGKEVIPCKLEPEWHDAEHTSWDVPRFEGGLAKISISGKTAYINKTGEVVWIQN